TASTCAVAGLVCTVGPTVQVGKFTLYAGSTRTFTVHTVALGLTAPTATASCDTVAANQAVAQSRPAGVYDDVVRSNSPYEYYRLDESSGATRAQTSPVSGWSATYENQTQFQFQQPGALTDDP